MSPAFINSSGSRSAAGDMVFILDSRLFSWPANFKGLVAVCQQELHMKLSIMSASGGNHVRLTKLIDFYFFAFDHYQYFYFPLRDFNLDFFPGLHWRYRLCLQFQGFPSPSNIFFIGWGNIALWVPTLTSDFFLPLFVSSLFQNHCLNSFTCFSKETKAQRTDNNYR